LNRVKGASRPRALTRLKPKSQVTIPKVVLESTGIKVGDLLEARASAHGVLLVPQDSMDKKLEDLRGEIRRGLESGPSKRFDFDEMKKRVRKKVAHGRSRASARKSLRTFGAFLSGPT
jgi:bifunctional DNA-binding transcriptional regulator/antitoxin component of YhaV-PrlF toxin-antitoxin module